MGNFLHKQLSLNMRPGFGSLTIPMSHGILPSLKPTIFTQPSHGIP